MDWLTFSDHLIGHLAWPAAVAGLVVFLSLRHRAAMDALLYRVRKAKAGPFEAELDKLEAAAAAASLPPAEQIELPEPSRTDPETWLGYLLMLADSDPHGAVVRAYHYLNSYAFEAAARLDPDRLRYTDGSPAVMRAAAVGLLAPEHVDVLDGLRLAAQHAEGGLEVSPRQAREYVELVARVVVAMRERLRALPETQG